MTQKEPAERALESWKEIAAYLQRDAKTARNWEKTEGLPVHRHAHKSRSSVYAYPSEIDAWRAGRRVTPEPVPTTRPWRRPAAAGLTTLLCLMMVGNSTRPVAAQQAAAAKAARQIWTGRPDSVSRDGRYFIFTDWPDLAIHDLATGLNRRLTNNGAAGYNESSVFSPDGRQIAYSWSSNSSNYTNEMRVVPVSGGDSRLLRRGEGTEYMLPQDWSPDGKQLLVSRFLPDGASQVALISLHDGSIRSLKSLGWQHFNASFSPDGHWIAYDSPPDPKTQARDIFVLAADGSRETIAVRNPADDFAPVWSPDGSRILFLSDRTGRQGLWSVSWVNGKPGQEELVKPDVSGKRILISRTGTLYYSVPGTGGPNIYSADIGSDRKVSGTPALAVGTFVNSNTGLALSPDGSQFAYLSRRQGSVPSLVIRSLKSGEERLVSAQVPLTTKAPKWFRDGRSVLAISDVPQGAGESFYQVDLASGKSTPVLRSQTGIRGFALSPDGKSIYYSELERLVRFDLETRQETELQTGKSIYDVAVSPDGTQLAYVDYVGHGGPGSNIAVMPATGGAAHEIFKDPLWDGGSRYNSLAWTPDQKYVLFTANDGGDQTPLRRVPVSGGTAEALGLSMPRLSSARVEPDGRRVFFVANQSGPDEVWALENFLPALQEK